MLHAGAPLSTARAVRREQWAQGPGPLFLNAIEELNHSRAAEPAIADDRVQCLSGTSITYSQKEALQAGLPGERAGVQQCPPARPAEGAAPGPKGPAASRERAASPGSQTRFDRGQNR